MRGQVIAQSGNTGRSFAPHLHYQLQLGNGQLLDPYESHATTRRSLESKAMAKFEAESARLKTQLGAPVLGSR